MPVGALTDVTHPEPSSVIKSAGSNPGSGKERADMQDEKGQTTTEYGLILMIVSIAVIGILVVAAGSLNELYTTAGDAVHTAVENILA